MKVCYCDESGMGDEPAAVMAGIIVDTQRMHLTKSDWDELLDELSLIVGRPIRELHTSDFYRGNGVWRGMTGVLRARTITRILDWIEERKHHIVITAIDKTLYSAKQRNGEIHREINTIWKALGFHTILAVQKAYQTLPKTKGHTIFILDNENKEEKNFKEIILKPPTWSDTYYNRKPQQDRLDCIIDVPYFADSTQVSLIQLADFISFFIRRYIEITTGHDAPRYSGEDTRIAEWIGQISGRCIGSSNTYPKRGRCDCATLFYEIAPDCIKDL